MENEKKDGQKFDNGKLRWSLLDLKTIEEALEVLEFGAVKYGVESWKRVPDGKTRYYDALMRHITAWKEADKNGDNSLKLDDETKKRHLSHAFCCLMFISFLDRE